MTPDRLGRLTAAAAAAGLDALGVVPGPNLIYLTGMSFHLSERPVMAFFPVAGTPVLVVPALEETKARGAPFECRVVTYDDDAGPRAGFAAALGDLAPGERWLGVEGRRIRYLELELMGSSGHPPHIFDADVLFADLRLRKDADEVARIRRAVVIAETAFTATLPALRPGVSEREVAAELVIQLLRAGSDAEIPFAPIVASGTNGALPHAVPTDRRLEPGDVVTLDWGATFEHYASDITRNVVVAGAPPHPDLVRAHEIVRAANEAGRGASGPAHSGADVDRAARSVIAAAGLADCFPHRTGHGLGLEGHEEPQAKATNLAPLLPGMVFTVEPGVYLPGLGGVRIEDDVVVTASGAETLTTLSRDLLSAG